MYTNNKNALVDEEIKNVICSNSESEDEDGIPEVTDEQVLEGWDVRERVGQTLQRLL